MFPEITNKTSFIFTSNALGQNYLHIYKLRKDFNLVLKPDHPLGGVVVK